MKDRHPILGPTTAISARTIGGAGTGKTHELMGVINKLITEQGFNPMQIGFVSFTRNAREEAANRAAELFSLDPRRLKSEGWFRTLHSVAFKCMGLKKSQVVSDDTKDKRQWLEQLFKSKVSLPYSPFVEGGSTLPTQADLSEDFIDKTLDKTDETISLTIWEYARNRMWSLPKTWEYTMYRNPQIPNLAKVQEIISTYETGKTVENYLDYSDMLSAYAGVRFSVEHEPSEVIAEGVEPEGVLAWFLDEAQDVSPLQARVFDRLVTAPGVRYVYLSGDPFQAIYSFAGSDPTIFRGWRVSKERTAPKSYRCPAEILELGELVLKDCTDYFNRHIEPSGKPGIIDDQGRIKETLRLIDPNEEWMILARANYMLKEITNYLEQGPSPTPWLYIDGTGRWNAPSRNHACDTLCFMEAGEPIMAEDWVEVLKFIKMGESKGGEQLLERGVKKKFAFATQDELLQMGEMGGIITKEYWTSTLGILPPLKRLIETGQWRTPRHSIIPYACDYYRIRKRWGREIFKECKVRVGTIHSAKGAQSDNVILLKTTTKRCMDAMEMSDEEANAERRCWYVGVTRARKRLFLVSDETRKLEFEF